jgi:hypothetical protein
LTVSGENEPDHSDDYHRQLTGDYAVSNKRADGQGMALNSRRELDLANLKTGDAVLPIN